MIHTIILGTRVEHENCHLGTRWPHFLSCSHSKLMQFSWSRKGNIFFCSSLFFSTLSWSRLSCGPQNRAVRKPKAKKVNQQSNTTTTFKQNPLCKNNSKNYIPVLSYTGTVGPYGLHWIQYSSRRSWRSPQGKRIYFPLPKKNTVT